MYSETKQTKMLEYGVERGLLQGRARRQVAHALKHPKLSWGFGKAFLKARWGREASVCEQLVHKLLWLMVREQGGVTGVNFISP